MTKYITWPINHNRPLSREERAIAERLKTDPAPRVVAPAQSWHSALGSKKEDEALVSREEA